jgi:hypothetical protein
MTVLGLFVRGAGNTATAGVTGTVVCSKNFVVLAACSLTARLRYVWVKLLRLFNP